MNSKLINGPADQEQHNKFCETASSDEQHRLQKMISGYNGFSYQDAVDEEIDNAIDSGATKCELLFENNIHRQIWNNGRSMDRTDRTSYLQMDSRNKKKELKHNSQKNLKGKFGIGSSASRARLAGQGGHHVISKDGNDVYSANIDLKYLAFEHEGMDCWSGNHDKKPRFEKINDSEGIYKEGVTKKYLGNDLEQRFKLNDVIIHFCKKYYNQIKNGLEIDVIWDTKIYRVPAIYNTTKSNTSTYDCFRYQNNDKNVAMFSMGTDDNYIIYYTNGGILKCRKANSPPHAIGADKYTICISFPEPNSYKDNIDKSCDCTRQQYINNNILSLFNNIHYDINKKGIILNCGENNIFIKEKEDDGDDDERVEEQSSKKTVKRKSNKKSMLKQ